MVGKKKYEDINVLLNEKFDKNKVLIAVHRGSWHGNVIENTNTAFRLALLMGADMFECDLTKSSDGEVYCYHDGGEYRMLRRWDNMKTMTSQDIDSWPVLNSIAHISGHKIQRFEDMLKYFTHGELCNIDRAWGFLPKVDEIMRKYPDAVKQAVIKTPVEDKYLEFFQNCDVKYMYMPIANSMEEVRKVLSYDNINVVGVEAIAKTAESEMIDPKNIEWMKEQGLYVWTNAITLGGYVKDELCGGHDDDRAVAGDEDGAWGTLVDLGYNVIQTDWPAVLRQYLDKKLDN